MFGPLRLVRALSDEQIEAMADPRRARMPASRPLKTPSSRGRSSVGHLS